MGRRDFNAEFKQVSEQVVATLSAAGDAVRSLRSLLVDVRPYLPDDYPLLELVEEQIKLAPPLALAPLRYGEAVTDGAMIGILMDPVGTGARLMSVESVVARFGVQGTFLTTRYTKDLRRPTSYEIAGACSHGCLIERHCPWCIESVTGAAS